MMGEERQSSGIVVVLGDGVSVCSRRGYRKQVSRYEHLEIFLHDQHRHDFANCRSSVCQSLGCYQAEPWSLSGSRGDDGS